MLLDSSRVIRDPNGHGALKGITINSCTSEILCKLRIKERGRGIRKFLTFVTL